jgi:hypothetical protein
MEIIVEPWARRLAWHGDTAFSLGRIQDLVADGTSRITS